MTLNQHIKQFLEYLEIEKGRSQRTCRNYEFYLKRFADWAKDPSPDKITTPVIKNYRLWLNRLTDAKNQSLKKNTQNYHLIALRSFLKYLAKNDVKTLASEKIELAKTPERTVEFLEGSDLERLLEAPQRIDNPDIIKKRDKAILELLFSTGLRVSELTSLTKDSLNLQKDEFTIRGKGDKPRIVFLSNQSKFWIRQYLEARKDMDPALFVSHDRAKKGRPNEKTANPLTPRSIQRLVKKYSKAA
ncbi:MAG TPA: tyrosine-type recombinase/integrase, partial [Patescibacteria group bacterium]